MTPPRIALSLLLLPLGLIGCERPRSDPGAPKPDTVQASFRETAPPARPAAPREEGMLFSVHLGDDSIASIEAVARVTPNGTITDPAPDSVSGEEFYPRWLNPGHSYTVLSGGRPVGTLVLTENDQEGCAVLGGAARPTLREKPWNALGALATNLPLTAPSSFAAPASPAERATMEAFLRREIETHGGRWKQDAEVHVFRVMLPGGTFALVGSASVVPHPEDDAAPIFAAFKIAEPGAEGALRTVLTWYHGPNDLVDDEYPRGRDLLDAADLDGDGTPELVARTAFYEAWSYTIYRRGANGWTEAYNGGGGGC